MSRYRHNLRTERGAALLIVTLVITLLVVVGMCAAVSTRRVTRAAGHARLMTEARYVTEQGIRTAAARVAIRPPFKPRQAGVPLDDEAPCKSTAFQRASIARHGVERCTMLHSDMVEQAWQVPMLEDYTPLGRLRTRKFAMDFTDEINWGSQPGEDAGAQIQGKRVTVHVRGAVGPWTTENHCADEQDLRRRAQTSTYRAVGTLIYRAQ